MNKHNFLTRLKFIRVILVLLLSLCINSAFATTEVFEKLSDQERLTLKSQLKSDINMDYPLSFKLAFENPKDAEVWLNTMSNRLKKLMPDQRFREDFLKTLHYEATRAGLDPQMVLGVISVESDFQRYTVSHKGATGLMQIMPFWVQEIGTPQDNLFDMKTNLRYGCTILRHYLNREKGDLFRALGRYNGSLGRSFYPNLVLKRWHEHWKFK